MNFTGLKLHNHARPGLSVTQHVRRGKLWTQNVVYYHLRIVFCTVGGLGKSDPFSAPYKPVTLLQCSLLSARQNWLYYYHVALIHKKNPRLWAISLAKTF